MQSKNCYWSTEKHFSQSMHIDSVFHAFIAPNLLQLLVSLLHQLREWCDETSSDPVRAAIAALIGTNWDIFVNSEKEDNGCSSSHLFWQMSVTLLQDVKEEVREKMCSSLSEMLSSTCSGTP